MLFPVLFLMLFPTISHCYATSALLDNVRFPSPCAEQHFCSRANAWAWYSSSSLQHGFLDGFAGLKLAISVATHCTHPHAYERILFAVKPGHGCLKSFFRRFAAYATHRIACTFTHWFLLLQYWLQWLNKLLVVIAVLSCLGFRHELAGHLTRDQ